MSGPVAQWIRHLTTNQGIPGSNPGGIVFFFFSEVQKFKYTQNIRVIHNTNIVVFFPVVSFSF